MCNSGITASRLPIRFSAAGAKRRPVPMMTAPLSAKDGTYRRRLPPWAAIGAGALVALALLAAACGGGGGPAASRGPGGRIAFVSFRDGQQEIYLLDLDAGVEAVNLTDEPGPDIDPDWSPDGKRIAFASQRLGNLYLFVMNSDGSEVRQLTEGPGGDLGPRWSPDGKRIAFSRAGSLHVIDADGDNEKLVMAAEPKESAAPCKGGAFVGGWAPDGGRITYYAASVARQEGQICVVDPDGGEPAVLVDDPGVLSAEPSWSPDGRSIAFRSIRDGNHDVYVVDVESGEQKRLTSDPGLDIEPDWSPDGAWIAFASLRSGAPNFDIYIMRADGSDLRRLTTDPAKEGNAAWAP